MQVERCVKIYFQVENEPPKTVWLCQTRSGAGSRVGPPGTGLVSSAAGGGLGRREGRRKHRGGGPGSATNQAPAAKAMAGDARLAERLRQIQGCPGTRHQQDGGTALGTTPEKMLAAAQWLLNPPSSRAPGHDKKFK